jgi:hypothetical protein
MTKFAAPDSKFLHHYHEQGEDMNFFGTYVVKTLHNYLLFNSIFCFLKFFLIPFTHMLLNTCYLTLFFMYSEKKINFGTTKLNASSKFRTNGNSTSGPELRNF